MWTLIQQNRRARSPIIQVVGLGEAVVVAVVNDDLARPVRKWKGPRCRWECPEKSDRSFRCS